MILEEDVSFLEHFGVKGMKWGQRKSRDRGKMAISSSDSKATKGVKKDYNNLSDKEFLRKHATTKSTYARRVNRNSDPARNSPALKRAEEKVGKRIERRAGKKETGISRVRGAAITRNERVLKSVDKYKTGKKGDGSLAKKVDDAFLGKKLNAKRIDRIVNDRTEQNKRIKEGNLKTMDYIAVYGGLSLVDVAFTRTSRKK